MIFFIAPFIPRVECGEYSLESGVWRVESGEKDSDCRLFSFLGEISHYSESGVWRVESGEIWIDVFDHSAFLVKKDRIR